MPEITITSKKYPGISMPVPEIPGIEPPQAGDFLFSSGMKYQVSQITLDFVRKTLGSYPERVMRYLTVQISEPAPSIAIASPPPPPAHGEAIAPESTPEPEPELIELTDEDRDLIEVEIAKIDKLTVSQAEPIMISTATAVHLPVAVRRAYLEAAIAHDGIQKSLKTTASKLLEQL